MLRKQNYLYGRDDVTVPVNSNFGDYFVKKLLEYGDKVAFIDGVTDSKLTYNQIAQQAMNLAVSLYHMGVKKGDTIAICSENRHEFWATLVGIVCVGAVFTPYDIGNAAVEMKHILNTSKPNYIFCSPMAFQLHEKTFRSLNVKKFIIFGDQKLNNTLSFNDITTPVVSNDKTVIANNRLTRNVVKEEFETVEVEKNDSVFILYSSGTTGMPKGVFLTHFNIVVTCCCGSTIKFGSLRTLSVRPWWGTMGLVGSLWGLSTGVTYVTLPRFEIDLYLKTIEKYKIYQIVTIPATLVAVSKSQANYDLSSVVWILCGAAPLYKETVEAIRLKFPNSPGVVQGYGCTETSVAIAVDDYVDGRLVKPGSVGRIVPCTVLKVVGTETRKVLAANQQGEICVKGAMVMKGYVGKDRREDFDDEGFYKTGDIGYYDEDGYIHIVDRLKELIKYKSYQVAPAEVEAVLLQHPAVKDTGVVGIPDRNAGEVPLAFVVTQPGKTVSEKELQDFVAEKLSNAKRLRGGVRFVPEIPKNPNGKILRKVLRQMAASGKNEM